MTRESTVARVEDVDATVGVVEGRVAMSAQVSDTLRVEAPDHRPLSAAEPHATLRVVADDVRLVVDLDGHGLDALADALGAARDGEHRDRGRSEGEGESRETCAGETETETGP